jgi:hypothetical protein
MPGLLPGNDKTVSSNADDTVLSFDHVIPFCFHVPPEYPQIWGHAMAVLAIESTTPRKRAGVNEMVTRLPDRAAWTTDVAFETKGHQEDGRALSSPT